MSIVFKNNPLNIVTFCPRCVAEIPIKEDRWVGQQATIKHGKMRYDTIVMCKKCFIRLEAVNEIINLHPEKLEQMREEHETQESSPAGDSESTDERLYVPEATSRLPASLMDHK